MLTSVNRESLIVAQSSGDALYKGPIKSGHYIITQQRCIVPTTLFCPFYLFTNCQIVAAWFLLLSCQVNCESRLCQKNGFLCRPRRSIFSSCKRVKESKSQNVNVYEGNIPFLIGKVVFHHHLTKPNPDKNSFCCTA